MLETVREYALERFEEADSRHWQRRHAEHFVVLAEAAELDARRADQPAWLDRLEKEQGNWRAALAFARNHGLVDLELRLVQRSGRSGCCAAISSKVMLGSPTHVLGRPIVLLR